MANDDFLSKLFAGVGDAVDPLISSLNSKEEFASFLSNLGWVWDQEGNIVSIQSAFSNIESALDSLRNAVNTNDTDSLTTAGVNLTRAIADLSITNFSALPSPLNQAAFWNAFPDDVLEFLIYQYFNRYQPFLFGAFAFAGVLKKEAKDADAATGRLAYDRMGVAWERISQSIAAPQDIFKDVYGWGQTFKHKELMLNLGAMLAGFHALAKVSPASERLLDLYYDADNPSRLETQMLVAMLFQLDTPTDDLEKIIKAVLVAMPVPPKGDRQGIPEGIMFFPHLIGEAGLTIPLQPGIDLELSGGFDAEIMRALVRPSGVDVELPTLDAVTLKAKAEVRVNLTPPRIIIGGAKSTRLEFSKAHVALGLTGPVTDLEYAIEAVIDSMNLILDFSQSDNFLKTIFGSNPQTAPLNYGVTWSNKSGLRFLGNPGLEIEMPTHLSLMNVININAIYLSARADLAEKSTQVTIALTAGFTLGPISASVDKVGMKLDVAAASKEHPGNLGTLNLDLGFKPPSGVGLSIDTGVVKGGGYLYFNFDKEEYAGALELTIKDLFSLKAVGLITTRMPDGSPGFSLLIIITAEFGSPIQLGYGFTLSGVGGVLGLNRTMLLEPLAEGVRTGAINSVMFPTNVVENAPRIISDLKAFFPPAEGVFLIGPMAKIGWGTPNVITLSLGIIIEIPGNIAILGVLKVVLKNEEAEAPAEAETETEVLVLQVKFIGAIEFDKKRGWFYASLFESRILFMTIDGEMGILVAWGDDPNFVVSVGGFHPAFKAPPLPFPEPRRISISILNTDYARIRVDGYFAITPNTIQFGASVDLFFGFDAFKLDGQFAFDALFRAPPLYFIISVSTSVSVKVFGVGMFSVHFRGSLEGPTPWHIEGTGTVTLLFFDIPIDFSETWGEEVDAILSPIRVMKLVETEFNKLENWKTTLPQQTRLFVSLRKIETTNDLLVLHPVGTLQISQRAVPLELQLDKVGDQKPEDVNYLSVAVNAPGLLKKADLNESFAMAQFKNMDDSKKLSSPSYEKWKAGLELAAATAQANASLAIKRVVRYEKIIIDTNYRRFIKPLFVWVINLFSLFLNGNAVAKSTISQFFLKQKQPFTDKIVIQDETWVVASSTDNSPFHATAGSFSSQAKAYEYLEQQIAVNPKLADNIHVIPQTEMRRVA